MFSDIGTKKEKKRFGKTGAKRWVIDELARRLIANRVQRVGYVRSGWLGSMQFMYDMAKVYGKGRYRGTYNQMKREAWQSKRLRQYKYAGQLATENDPVAWIVNTAMGQKDKKPHPEAEKYKVAEDGLRKGLAVEQREMRMHL